jgi:hypothetical protein
VKKKGKKSSCTSAPLPLNSEKKKGKNQAAPPPPSPSTVEKYQAARPPPLPLNSFFFLKKGKNPRCTLSSRPIVNRI